MQPELDVQKSGASRLTWAIATAGHIGMLAIIVLSLVPGSARPHTGAGGGLEHWMAYLLVAACYGLSHSPGRPPVATGLMLVAAAAILEFLQIFIPGRNAEFSGFAASSLGACAGLIGGLWLRNAIRMRTQR